MHTLAIINAQDNAEDSDSDFDPANFLSMQLDCLLSLFACFVYVIHKYI